MAKSQIIKDIANNSIDTITALKRAKVLFSELNNNRIIAWINNEINGYPSIDSLPPYRTVTGYIKGTFIHRSIKYTNSSLPLGKMPDDIKRELLNVYFLDGIEALKQMQINCNANHGLVEKPIPADCFGLFYKYCNDPFLVITSVSVNVGAQAISNIVSTVENRLMDSLLLLEKEFGNLDELDIDTTSKEPDELDEITSKLLVIIFNDNSISIGNDNKIKDTDIKTLNEAIAKESSL